MADFGSGPHLPSRDAQERTPGPPWQAPTSNEQNDSSSKASLALAILSEKIKSGALRRDELMNRLVAQASVATGANGVALALRREGDGRVVCTAATGDMAPPAGTILDEGSGFTAECLRNGVLMICEDTDTDSRVDGAACRRLGVRSIVAAPIENDGATVGVLEALSEQQAAFTKQHIELLLTLACFAKSAVAPKNAAVGPSLASALAAIAPAVVEGPPVLEADDLRDADLLERMEDTRSWSERVPKRLRLAIAFGVAAALLLGLFATAIFIWMWRHDSTADMSKATKAEPQRVAAAKPSASRGAVATPVSARVNRSDHPSGRKSPIVNASAVEKISSGEAARIVSANPSAPRSAFPSEDDVAAPDALTPVGKGDTTELGSVLSVPQRVPAPALPTFEGVTPARLQYRVEPIYPAEARHQRIEGAVVLRAAIDAGGNVHSVGVVKGSPVLARAAMAAVRQWRYQPSELNHRPTASTTEITIMFHLE